MSISPSTLGLTTKSNLFGGGSSLEWIRVSSRSRRTVRLAGEKSGGRRWLSKTKVRTMSGSGEAVADVDLDVDVGAVVLKAL